MVREALKKKPVNVEDIGMISGWVLVSKPNNFFYIRKGNSNFELGTAICFIIVRK